MCSSCTCGISGAPFHHTEHAVATCYLMSCRLVECHRLTTMMAALHRLARGARVKR